MKFLVISGAPSTGKTTAINKIAEWVTSTNQLGLVLNYVNNQVVNSLPNFQPYQLPHQNKPTYNDFSLVITINNRKILIHSATDDRFNLDNLIDRINQYPDIEIVITSCRDIYWERDYFTKNIRPFFTFFLESPLGKITRRNDFNLADTWYKDNLLALHQHILKNNPYNL